MRFLSALAILFIALKLLNIITWSWWLVLLPLYGVIVALIGGGILLAFLAGLIVLVTSYFDNRSKAKRVK
jgi:hypothetical protein